MRSIIKKILKEDFNWVSTNTWETDDLPIKELDKLMEYYDEIHEIKNKLSSWLDGKEGGEIIYHSDNYSLSPEESREKFKKEHIIEAIRFIYHEINNIDASLFQLPDQLAELENLVIGKRGEKYEKWYEKRL